MSLSIKSITAFLFGALLSYLVYDISDDSTEDTITTKNTEDITTHYRLFEEMTTDGNSTEIELLSDDPPKVYVPPSSHVNPTFSKQFLDSEWDLDALNQKVLENMPDIDAILKLTPPQPSQKNKDVWLKFARSLKNISTGKRYSHHGTNTPLLVWYVYIAKYNPESIYTLFNNRELDSYKFVHLLEHGYLLDWWRNVHSTERLILTHSRAFLSLIFNLGETKAKELYISAFFSHASSSSPIRLDVSNFLYSLSDMTSEQKEQALVFFRKKKYIFDPRKIELLKTSDEWRITDLDILDLIELNVDDENRGRSMSSYFTTAAKLGSAKHFSMLMKDTPHNDSQPTNFYCAACGLALVSDGLIGSSLVQKIEQQADISFFYDKKRNEFIIENLR